MALAIVCLAARLASGQEFVRVAPNLVGMTEAQRRGLYTNTDLGGETPADTLPTDVSGLPSPEEADQLIDRYRREAGTLGPSKLFSAAKLGLRVGIGVAYDDNIRSATGSRKEGDEITTFTGRASVSLGDYVDRQTNYLVLDYALAENVFATHGDEDALDQDGLFDVRYHWNRLAAEFMSQFQETHDPTSDTAERESRYLYDEALTFQYRYGDKTTLGARLSYDREDVSFGDSNQQYALEGSADYQVFDKIELGLGAVLGRLETDSGLHETYEQLLARLQYQLTGKVSLSMQVGIDVRERGAYAGDGVTPVFALEGRWTPYEGTTVTVAGARHVNASESITGEDFTSSTIQVNFRQRFLRQFYFIASAGYTHSDYDDVARSSTPPRTDDYYFLQVGADYEAQKYFDVGLFYQRQQNDSTLSIYSYASNRVYLQTHFIF